MHDAMADREARGRPGGRSCSQSRMACKVPALLADRAMGFVNE